MNKVRNPRVVGSHLGGGFHPHKQNKEGRPGRESKPYDRNLKVIVQAVCLKTVGGDEDALERNSNWYDMGITSEGVWHDAYQYAPDRMRARMVERLPIPVDVGHGETRPRTRLDVMQGLRNRAYKMYWESRKDNPDALDQARKGRGKEHWKNWPDSYKFEALWEFVRFHSGPIPEELFCDDLRPRRRKL